MAHGNDRTGGICGGMIMWLIRLFTSFEGRISRRAFWLGLIALILISPFSIGAILSKDPFSEALASIGSLGLVGLGWSLALLYPLAALIAKRLHDRDKTAVLAALFYAPAAVNAVVGFTGWTWLADKALYVMSALGLLLGGVSAWFLVELGFFPGTRGPNKYGPDPGGAA